MTTPDAPSPSSSPPPSGQGPKPAPAASPTSPPRAAGGAPAPRPFVMHRASYPSGGGPSLGPDRRVRMLVALGVLFALAWAVHWLIFGRASPQVPLLPPVIDRVKLGMTVGDLERLGGKPQSSGGPVEEVAFSRDFTQGNVTTITGEWLDARTRFDADGKLVRFEVEVDKFDRGAPVDLVDLLALAPVLVEAKTLRRPYPLADVEDALGRGRRVGRILDAATGEEDVFRWDVESTSRDAARFEVHARAGTVVEHRMTTR